MNQNIFQTHPLVGQSFFQKLLKQHPEENAIIELNNLLATRQIKEILTRDIADIETRYKLVLGLEFKLNLEEFYAVYLNYFLDDKVLSEDEIQNLKHLKMILSLDDNSINNLHNKIGLLIYKSSFEEAISDGRLTENEKEFLNRLESDLKLPKELVEKLSSAAKTDFIQGYISNILEDQKLSPVEEKEMQAVANSLNVTVEVDSQTKKQLDKLKLYWSLENLPLMTIEPDIVIQKSEQLYFRVSNVKWYELRNVSPGAYSRYSTNIMDAKKFYLKSGNTKSFTDYNMKLIDTGTLYLTNKRIIFTGTMRNSNIRLEKIMHMKAHLEGVEINKDTGRTPLIKIAGKEDIFFLLLDRLTKSH